MRMNYLKLSPNLVRKTVELGQVLRESGLIRTVQEEEAVAKVLRAAAWTYVAAFITSLAYLLLHLLPLLGSRRD